MVVDASEAVDRRVGGFRAFPSSPQPEDAYTMADGPLILLMDNDWSTAPDWEQRVRVADRLIEQAAEQDIPVSLVFTAEKQHNAIPNTASAASDRLQAVEPRPLKADRAAAIAALTTAYQDTSPGTLAILTSGVKDDSAESDWQALVEIGPQDVLLFEPDGKNVLALITADNDADGFALSAARLDATDAAQYSIAALDIKGRPIAGGELTFEEGQSIGPRNCQRTV